MILGIAMTKQAEEKFGGVKPVDLHEGLRVVYHPVGHASQTSVGKITKVITHPEEVGTRHTVVKASEHEPRYVPACASVLFSVGHSQRAHQEGGGLQAGKHCQSCGLTNEWIM